MEHWALRAARDLRSMFCKVKRVVLINDACDKCVDVRNDHHVHEQNDVTIVNEGV